MAIVYELRLTAGFDLKEAASQNYLHTTQNPDLKTDKALFKAA